MRRIVVQGTIIVLIVGPVLWTVKHTFLLYKDMFLRYAVSRIAYVEAGSRLQAIDTNTLCTGALLATHRVQV